LQTAQPPFGLGQRLICYGGSLQSTSPDFLELPCDLKSGPVTSNQHLYKQGYVRTGLQTGSAGIRRVHQPYSVLTSNLQGTLPAPFTSLGSNTDPLCSECSQLDKGRPTRAESAGETMPASSPPAEEVEELPSSTRSNHQCH